VLSVSFPIHDTVSYNDGWRERGRERERERERERDAHLTGERAVLLGIELETSKRLAKESIGFEVRDQL